MCDEKLQTSLYEFKKNIIFFIASLYVSVFTFQFLLKIKALLNECNWKLILRK